MTASFIRLKKGMRLSLILLIIFVLLMASCHVLSAFQSKDNFFKSGQIFDDGWIIKEVTNHSEFIRLHLNRGTDTTSLEITGNKAVADRWSSKFYRVQPAPNADPPIELLDSVVLSLRQMEQEHGHFLQLEDAKYKNYQISKQSKLEKKDIEFVYNVVFPDLNNKQVKQWLLIIFFIFILFLGYMIGIYSGVGGNRNLNRVTKHIQQDTAAVLIKLFGILKSFLVLMKLNIYNYDSQLVNIGASEKKHNWWRFILAFGVSFSVFVIWSPDVPLIGDTYHFMLLAKDCFAGLECHWGGTNSSLEGVFLGGLWVHFLLLIQYLNLNLSNAQLIVSITYSLGVALVYIACLKYISRKMALLSSVIYLLLSLKMIEYPILWNDSLLPFTMGLFTYYLFAIISERKFAYVIIASVALALCTECHLINSVMVPGYLFILAIVYKGFARYLCGSLIIFLTVIGLSYEAYYNNSAYLISTGLIVPIVVGYFLIWLLGSSVRRIFHDNWSVSTNLLVSHALLASIFVLLLSMSFYTGHFVRLSYYEPALMGLSFLLANILIGSHRKILYFLERNNIRHSKMLPLIILISVSALYIYSLQIFNNNNYSQWTVKDARILAKTLYEKGYSFEYLENHLLGQDRADLLRAFLAYEPIDRNKNQIQEKDGHDIQVLKIKGNEKLTKQSLGNFYIIDGDNDYQILVQTLHSIINRNEVELCRQMLDANTVEECVILPVWKPRAGSHSGNTYREKFYLIEDDIDGGFSYRGFDDRKGEKKKYTLRFKTVLSGEDRPVVLKVANNKGYSKWKIEQINELEYEGKLYEDSITLINANKATGNIVISTTPCYKSKPKICFPSVFELDSQEAASVN